VSRDGRRWMGVGHSEYRDSGVAATAAAAAALVGDDPKLLIVFASIEHDGAAVLAGLRTVALPCRISEMYISVGGIRGARGRGGGPSWPSKHPAPLKCSLFNDPCINVAGTREYSQSVTAS